MVIEHVLVRTLFFCHFWWGTKDNVFDVFNDPENCIHEGQVPDYSKTCVWVVKSDGFYLAYYDEKNGTLIKSKTYDWLN